MPRKSTTIEEQPIPVPRRREPIVVEAENIEEDMIIIKRGHFYAALSVLTFFFGMLAGYVIWGTDAFSNVGNTARAANQVETAEEPQVIRYDIPTAGYPSRGPADAPITIVEFSDFQCPYCKRWFAEVYEPLLAEYAGQIRFVYRNLPLTSIHPDAFSAAEAAMCANEQNAFWGFHDKLLSGDLLGAGVYAQYANDLNLNASAFESCLNAGTYRAAIQADSDFAINLGVNSTPTFFINGLAVIGAQPIDVFKQVIDKELAGEFPQ
jgi:protein-disulfide isomerase